MDGLGSFTTVSNGGNINVTGGTINNGIDVLSGATLTLGKNDGSVSISSPVINLGIRNNATFNFYDGIITGANGDEGIPAITGDVTSTPSGYSVAYINDNLTAFLKSSNSDIYNITQGVGYSRTDLNLAVSDSENGDKLIFFADIAMPKINDSYAGTYSAALTIPSNKNISIDLNGHTLSNKGIYDDTIEIKEGASVYMYNGEIKGESDINLGTTTFINSGKVVLNNVNVYKGDSNHGMEHINNLGEMEIINCEKIRGSYISGNTEAVKNSGKIKITNSNVNGYINNEGECTMIGGTCYQVINDYKYSIINGSDKSIILNIDGVKFSGDDNGGNSIKINNGICNIAGGSGSVEGIYLEKGTLNIGNGKIVTNYPEITNSVTYKGGVFNFYDGYISFGGLTIYNNLTVNVPDGYQLKYSNNNQTVELEKK